MNRPAFPTPLEMLQECVNNCMKICTCGGGEETSPVVVLRKDGQVMEFPGRIRCSELLATNPHFRICHASALLLKQKGQILSTTAWLQPGEIYFLLPKPGTPVTGAKAAKGPESSLQFKIPKEYLDKVLGNAAKPGVRKKIKKQPPTKVVLRRSKSRSNMLTSLESSLQFIVPKDMLTKTGDEGAAARIVAAAQPPLAPTPILRRCPSVGKARPQIRLRLTRTILWQPPLDTITEGSSRSSNGGTSSRSSATSRSFAEHIGESSSSDHVGELAGTSCVSPGPLTRQLQLKNGAESAQAEVRTGVVAD